MPEQAAVEKELAALRKEVYEARSLIIKTDNLLKTFHAELKAIAARQEASERHHLVGHVGAYIVIGLLAAGGAAYMIHALGAHERSQAKVLLDAAKKKRTAAEKAEREAADALAARDRASKQALEAYRSITSEDTARREKGLAALAHLDESHLSPFARSVLGEVEGRVRRQTADEAFTAGLAAYHRGAFKDAVTALERFFAAATPLPKSWSPDERTRAAYYLGAAYSSLGEHTKAVTRLEEFLSHDASRGTKAYANLLLGRSLEALGRSGEAKAAYTAGLRTDPGGKSSSALQRRLSRLRGSPAPGRTAPAPKTPEKTKAAPETKPAPARKPASAKKPAPAKTPPATKEPAPARKAPAGQGTSG